MDYLTNRTVTHSSTTGKYTYHPWYMGKDKWGGRLISWRYIDRGEPIPGYLGIAYKDYLRHAVIYYPTPLNYVIRFKRGFWNLVFWRGIFSALWWIGVIDTPPGYMFVWGDFWRIRPKE